MKCVFLHYTLVTQFLNCIHYIKCNMCYVIKCINICGIKTVVRLSHNIKVQLLYNETVPTFSIGILSSSLRCALNMPILLAVIFYFPGVTFRFPDNSTVNDPFVLLSEVKKNEFFNSSTLFY